jgi:hypothetical protein
MNIDDYGRADIFYEYPVNNIAGSNIPMDKVSGAAIVKLVEGNIISVMSGFASTEVPEWKKFDIVTDENRSFNEIKNEEEKIKLREKSIFDKYEESIEIIKQSEIEENTDKVNRQKITENIEKEESTDPIEEEIKREIEEPLRQQSLEDMEQDKKPEDEAIDYPRGTTAKFFKSLTEGFEEIPDIIKEIKRCKWHKVPVRNLESMYDVCDYNKYTVVYYPMMNYYSYIKKYDHYLIGYKYNEEGEPKYLVYGIPGVRDRKEQPYEGRSGFVTWVPMDYRSDFGYWLMFYDFKTSTILIPEKK